MDPKPPQPNINAGENKERPKKRILVADDHDGVRKAVFQVLSLGHYQIDVVEDGQQLLDKLEAGEKYDLIITDNSMPNVTGMDVLKKLKSDSRFKDMPIILHSTTDLKEIVEKLGGKFLMKGSFDMLDFVDKILEESK